MVDNIFGYNIVFFGHTVTNYWSSIEKMPSIDTHDKGTLYSLKLKTLASENNGILQKFCVALSISSPYLMTIERFISYYNQIKADH